MLDHALRSAMRGSPVNAAPVFLPTRDTTATNGVRSITRAALLLSILVMASCGNADKESSPAATTTANSTANASLKAAIASINSCVDGGSFKVDTFGAIETSIAWHDNDMSCEGMPRPANAGARLRFAGDIGEGDERHGLSFILSIPDLSRESGGDGLPTRVTIIEEYLAPQKKHKDGEAGKEKARFFSTRETDVCWSNVHYAEKLAGDWVRVGGTLYCVAPIADVYGGSSVTLSELHFNGRLRWKR